MRVIISLLILFTSVIPAQVQVEVAFPNLVFSSPVDLQNAGDGTDRIFVVEQQGKIKVFSNDQAVAQSQTFLDITDRVSSGGEMGLLGLAFHPAYESNGYFYVNYTASNPRRTHISRFSASASNPNQADPNSELILMSINQPYSNHNGGQVAFGADGCLYIALGDGGSGGDPQNNAQNKTSLLGKILRIDVDNIQPPLNYAIPPDNPFAGNTQGYLEEIYAFGLRNTWRFSFDRETNQLWAGDVGQGQWEEINIIQNGGNYGWRCYEGNHEYNTSLCNAGDYLFPIHEYGHNAQGGYSITGGLVYRGSTVPFLSGKYVYADYVSKRIWALEYDSINGAQNRYLLTAPANITSFGVDANDELYFVSFDGKIYKFVSAALINAPTNLIAQPSSSGEDNFISLNWQDNSSSETGFKIERKNEGGIFLLIDSASANSVSYEDYSIENNQSYIYRIYAFNEIGTSIYSNQSPIVTSVPVEFEAFSAIVENEKVILNWTTSTETNNRLFEIERYINDGWVIIGSLSGNGTTTLRNSYSFIDDLKGSHINGIVKYRINQIDYDGSSTYSNIQQVEFGRVDVFFLHPNYPNPFNPVTTIDFQIHEKSKIKLEIFNALGALVDVLIDEEVFAGYHSVRWNAPSFPSGVYFALLSASSSTGKMHRSTAKLILIK
ncbi:MAG: hypothetical protein AUK34_02910 [Ignavibacteria bacterium CG2_30_36_16]|nr:MAG: hypothetical protein AUK34_02910 [Ignavibacteria bacterium CG2_30_36_16]PJB00169.1 MAG: hypothetical protein CO127_09070 [Ignavibacteria bacterium CG_4_9_14_3_um_filter_36_18]